MILDNIKVFIDSGWYTVPYDRIYYNEKGKKVIEPMRPWSRLVHERNLQNSPAGAVICSNLMVVDCDTEEAAQKILDVAKLPGIVNLGDLAKASDHIGLVVKTGRGYHFYFEADPDIEYCKGPNIDIQATEKRLVFLPTLASEGKTIVAARVISEDGVLKIKLGRLPESLKTYILSLKDSKEETAARKKIRFTGGCPLAKIDKGSKLYFRRLTPKHFRGIPAYRFKIDTKGYLHPNDIVDGDGNEYMIHVAAILASDPTIDINNFWDNMRYINSCWTEPLSDEVLVAKVKGYAEDKYPGCPFNYDEDWEKAAYSFTDVDGVDMTVCYDLNSSKYLVVELDSGKTYLKTSGEIVSFYANRTGTKINPALLASQLPGVEIVFDPLRDFGLSEDKKFNVFKHSKYVEILRSEAAYSKEEIEWSKSCEILKFFSHLFREQSEYWLKFLKRKLTTFKYSPTAFCLFDIEGGAGKGALESWLGYFVGKDKVSSIPYETFKSKFTSDIEGKLFVFLNEYPDDQAARRANTDKIKSLTGSPVSKIEKKGMDPYETVNFSTYMITSNRVSVEVKNGDRRFCVMQCVAKFDDVFREGFFETITSDEEMTKLAIYLRYCVDDLSHNEYMRPPMSEAKEMFLEAASDDTDKAVEAIVSGDWSFILELDSSIIHKDEDMINLTKLAKRLNIPSATLTSKLKPYVSTDRLDMTTFTDRNRKFGPKISTYGRFPKGTLADCVIKSDTNESRKVDLRL